MRGSYHEQLSESKDTLIDKLHKELTGEELQQLIVVVDAKIIQTIKQENQVPFN